MTGPKLQQSGEETGQTIVFCIEFYGRKDIAFANFSFSSNKDPVSEIGDLMMWHHCLAARISQRIHAALIFCAVPAHELFSTGGSRHCFTGGSKHCAWNRTDMIHAFPATC